MAEFSKNLNISLTKYNKKFQSNHWLFNNKKKKIYLRKKIYLISEEMVYRMDWMINSTAKKILLIFLNF